MDKRSISLVVSPTMIAIGCKKIKILLSPHKSNEKIRNFANLQAEIDAELDGLNFDDDDDLSTEVNIH